MIKVTTDQLYAEVCRALGETEVRARLLADEVQRLTAENEALRQAQEPQPESAVNDGDHG